MLHMSTRASKAYTMLHMSTRVPVVFVVTACASAPIVVVVAMGALANVRHRVRLIHQFIPDTNKDLKSLVLNTTMHLATIYW